MTETAMLIAETGSTVFAVWGTAGLTLPELAGKYCGALRVHENVTYTKNDFDQAMEFMEGKHAEYLSQRRGESANEFARALIQMTADLILIGAESKPE